MCPAAAAQMTIEVHVVHVYAAQQEAQRAQFYVEKAKQDQKQKIIQAEGEAQAAKMVNSCLYICPTAVLLLSLFLFSACPYLAGCLALSHSLTWMHFSIEMTYLQKCPHYTVSRSKFAVNTKYEKTT